MVAWRKVPARLVIKLKKEWVWEEQPGSQAKKTEHQLGFSRIGGAIRLRNCLCCLQQPSWLRD